MQGQSTGPTLSVVFVDYDNIYLSLKRKNEEAARRFAKDAGGWLRGIENGRLITATQGANLDGPRRIVLNRCYGNPSPRRNPSDNSTDMNSFPFVRHQFLRAGFEVVDCPPLTAQLKNSADIKMVMDVLDFLKHQTYFDEFVLLSGDADFTPVLHRLRAHARRTIIYSCDNTAVPYTAISDGEIRQSDLITLLMEGRVGSEGAEQPLLTKEPRLDAAQIEQAASRIVAEVAGTVQSAGQPVPLEALADRAIRVLGHDTTVATNWGGAGSFRDLLSRKLPGDLRLSEQPPYYVFDASRQLATEPASEARRIEAREPLRAQPQPKAVAPAPRAPAPHRPEARIEPQLEPQAPAARGRRMSEPLMPQDQLSAYMGAPAPAPAPSRPAAHQRAPMGPAEPSLPAGRPQSAAAAQPDPAMETPTQIQQSIAKIHNACQAPPLSPPDYRALFDAMAEEITSNGLMGGQTITNIAQRVARAHGVEIYPDDIRFVMEVVSEPDPWFEQGASSILLANRFRNYVIAQCRRQHMSLSATEIDLIEMWFTGSATPQAAPGHVPATAPPQARAAAPAPRAPEPQAPAPQPQHHHHPAAAAPGYGGPAPRHAPPKQERSDRWWHFDTAGPGEGLDEGEDDFPRIIRPRARG